jgi:hypothetical protein
LVPGDRTIEAGLEQGKAAVTDFNASALDTDLQGLEFLRAVLGEPKRAAVGQPAMRAAEAASDLRSARRRARSRREMRAGL